MICLIVHVFIMCCQFHFDDEYPPKSLSQWTPPEHLCVYWYVTWYAHFIYIVYFGMICLYTLLILCDMSTVLQALQKNDASSFAVSYFESIGYSGSCGLKIKSTLTSTCLFYPLIKKKVFTLLIMKNIFAVWNDIYQNIYRRKHK